MAGCSGRMKSNEPQGTHEVNTYDFNGMSLRVVQIDGEPWFVSSDACAAMGDVNVRRKGTGHILRHLSDDEKTPYRLRGNGQKGNPNKVLISESGLYKLITRSDKPEAKYAMLYPLRHARQHQPILHVMSE